MVCSKCHIPICKDCWSLARSNKSIPKALCNDNVIGYMCFSSKNDLNMEATIACPIFSGLIIYYIESPQEARNPKTWKSLRATRQHMFFPVAIGTHRRNNWRSLSRRRPCTIGHLMQVRLEHGPAEIPNKTKELHVRAPTVKQVAHIYIYIDVHVQDIASRPDVLKIHREQR